MDYIMLDPILIKEFGYNKSILINHVYYWCSVHELRNSDKSFKEGKHWMFNSSSKIVERYDFMNERTVRNCFVELEKDGWVISSNFNLKKYDNTKWYRCTDKFHQFLEECSEVFLDKIREEIALEESTEFIEFNLKSKKQNSIELNKTCVTVSGSSTGNFCRPIQYINTPLFNIYNNSLTSITNSIIKKEKNKKEKISKEEKLKKFIFRKDGYLRRLEYSKYLSKSEKIDYVRREKPKQFFDDLRKIYRGRVRGLLKEFDWFVSRYKKADWNSYDIIQDLFEMRTWIVRQNLLRDTILKSEPDFWFYDFAHFKTWINDRGWESVDPKHEEKLKEILKKQAEEKRKKDM